MRVPLFRCQHACTGGHLNKGLPASGSTDPRFIGPPGGDAAFLADMARAGISASPQALINVAHSICADLARGYTYNQEATTLLKNAPSVIGSSDNAVRVVEDSREDYCQVP